MKPQKAMTDEEIYSGYRTDLSDITKKEILVMMAQARQQERLKYEFVYDIDKARKEEYANGVADGKKEVLLNEKVYLKRINQVEQILKYQHNEMEKKYLEGRKDGVVDSKKAFNLGYQKGRADAEKERPKHFHIDYKKRYETVLKVLAEATKEGDGK